MLYSYGRFLLPHLPLDRDASVVKVGDEVALQYYRLERVHSGAIAIKEGEGQYIKSPTDIGTTCVTRRCVVFELHRGQAPDALYRSS